MEVLSQIAFLLLNVLIVAVVLVSIVVLVWIGRTLSAMREQNAAVLPLLTSIEAEARSAGTRERWPVRSD